MLTIEAKDRKLEIKRKQDRLAELRKARLERGETIVGLTAKNSTSLFSTKEDIDSFITSLIGPAIDTPKEYDDQDKIEKEKFDENLKSVPTKRDLSVIEICTVSLFPEEIVTYSKEMQTDQIIESIPDGAINDHQSIQDQQFLDEDTNPVTSQAQDFPALTNISQFKELSVLEASAILHSDSFQAFLDKSSKAIERALHEEYDILKDYTQDLNLIGIERLGSSKNAEAILKNVLTHERWSKNRCATSVDWSPFFPELFLVSLSKNTSNGNESDGIILIWNIHMPSRPEFVLHSQSEVTVAKFSPFKGTCIFGGTYSGQVLIWDTKMKNSPIISSSLSLPGHSHPIYSLSIIGTHNANNLITISTDGTLCSWPTDILNEPQEFTELMINNEVSGVSKIEEVSVTCSAFSRLETSIFFIGTEEKSIYQVNRFDRAGNKAGIEKGVVYVGHQSAITGLEFHPFSAAESNGLFLSCSMDWAIKLWKVQNPSSNHCINVSPLKSFEDGTDYIADISWCPTHPAIFAAIDGSGRLYIFDLNINSDASIYQADFPNLRGCNKLKWDAAGENLAICSLDGEAFVFDTAQFTSRKSSDDMGFLKDFL